MNLFNEVFVGVIGTTPQVLTECLYYYYSKHYGIERVFNKIVVITTEAGKNILEERVLLSGEINNLELELGISEGSIPFSIDDIYVIEDEAGIPLVDVRTPNDNQLATAQIFKVLRSITDDESVRVTATVAGGRKTMSTTMAAAFQIYARQQDELIHLITHDSKFGVTDWYFPNDPTDPTQKLDVSKVPVLKIGRYLRKDLIGDPDTLIAEIQESLKALNPLNSVVINKKNLTVNETVVSLTPRIASIMRFLLKRRTSSTCSYDCQGCIHCCIDRDGLLKAARQDLIEEFEIIVGSHSGHFHRYRESRKTADYFTINNRIDEDISRQRSLIRNAKIPTQHRDLLQIRKVNLEHEGQSEAVVGILVNRRIVTIEN